MAKDYESLVQVQFGACGGVDLLRTNGGEMRIRRAGWTAVVVTIAGAASVLTANGKAGADGTAEVKAFNEKFRAAHERMDTPGILGMWSETGVSLLPETAPMVGKPAVTKFMTNAVANLAGYKELKVETCECAAHGRRSGRLNIR